MDLVLPSAPSDPTQAGLVDSNAPHSDAEEEVVVGGPPIRRTAFDWDHQPAQMTMDLITLRGEAVLIPAFRGPLRARLKPSGWAWIHAHFAANWPGVDCVTLKNRWKNLVAALRHLDACEAHLCPHAAKPTGITWVSYLQRLRPGTGRLPLDAFDASIKSSINFFNLEDWRSSTSIYSAVVSS